MANYATLKAAINAVIKANGNKEITGTVLNETLTAIVNSLGADYQFAGVATPSTNPGTPDQNVFYLAHKTGLYANFGGLIVEKESLYVLSWNGEWNIDDSLDLEEIYDSYVQQFIELLAEYQPIVIEGNVTNAPDEEDLTSVDQGGTDVLKFKNKAFLPAYFTGLGRIYLRKNIVDGKNLLTQAMISEPNTIYHIQYDYELAEDITIPENCMLQFEGGSVSGTYTITGQNTGIQAGLVKIFNTDITFAGTWNVVEAYPEWFGAKGDGIVDDTASLNNTSSINKPIVLKRNSVYHITSSWSVNNSIIGNGATIHAVFSNPQEVYSLNRAIEYVESTDFVVDSINVESDYMGLCILGCKKFKITNCKFKCTKFNIYITGVRAVLSEQFIIENILFNNIINYDNISSTANSDGIHINGGVRGGIISNCTGICGDDYIGFNSSEYAEGQGESKPSGLPLEFNTISEIVVNNFIVPRESNHGIRIFGMSNSENVRFYIRNITFNSCKLLSGGYYYDRGLEGSIGEPVVNIVNCHGDTTSVAHPRLNVENVTFNNCVFDKYGSSILIIGIVGTVEFCHCSFDRALSETSMVVSDNDVFVTFEDCLIYNIQTWQTAAHDREGINRLVFNNCRLNAYAWPSGGANQGSTIRRINNAFQDSLDVKLINCLIINTDNFTTSSYHRLIEDSVGGEPVHNRKVNVHVENMNTPICIDSLNSKSLYHVNMVNVAKPLFRVNTQLESIIRMVDCYLSKGEDEYTSFFALSQTNNIKIRCLGNSCRIGVIPVDNAIVGDCILYVNQGNYVSLGKRTGAGQWVFEDLCGYSSTIGNKSGVNGQRYFSAGDKVWCYFKDTGWVDILGNPIGTVYPKVIGNPTNGNLAKFNSTNIEDAGVTPT